MSEQLKTTLRSLNKKSYKAYKDLTGKLYRFDDFELAFDHIQGDPFAAPSKVTVQIPIGTTGFPTELFDTTTKSRGFRDALTRVISKQIRKHVAGRRGTGGSGSVIINTGGQKILERNSVVIKGDTLLIRLLVGLPAFGRRIAGDHAQEMFFKELPAVVNDSLFWNRLDHGYFRTFVDLVQKQERIRNGLKERGLIAFVADNAVLPRFSGIDDTPLKDAVPFDAPESLRTTFTFDDGMTITGMGIRQGITIITGGGFHGKSTLLQAVQNGIYDHIPGDGREYVISVPDMVKIRAEDGRNIEKVDISTFIKNLPQGKDTGAFITPNASGSTSQAANIMEAVEVGTEVLLMDEDTCATNFLIRDKRMQELIPAEKEPITPFIDVAPELSKQTGVSTVFVVGGSGDYIDIADTVIMLDRFHAHDVTDKAKEIAQAFPYTERKGFSGTVRITPRYPHASSINPSKGKKDANIKTREQKIIFGRDDIDLSQWEHIVERTQLDTIADILLYGLRTGLFKERMSIDQCLDAVMKDVEKNGLDTIFERSGRRWSYYCQVRKVDVAAALNRLRTLEVRQ